MAGGLSVGQKRRSDKGDEEVERGESGENVEVIRTKKKSRKVNNTCK
jgi:hypothetical protein